MGIPPPAMAAPLFAGRYRLRDTLSSTTMAEVWLATDSELDRQVVVKLLASGADRGRFEREARAAAGLSHPNIVQLFDFGEEGGRPYMVFEYLAGGSLEDRLVNGDRLTSDEVTTVAGEVAAGLAHAHEHGVVHRDLKPGNVLFDGEGRSKIADFGIARVLGTDTLTDAGTVLGTAAYISPEQVRGELATPASDVYSFGVILYRLLAGRLPFEAESPTELARLHRDAEPPPLPPVREELRRPAAVATSALAKEPAERPADGTALVRSLEGGAVADAATTRILPPPVAPTRFPRRRLALLAAIAILVIAAAGLLAAIVLSGGQASAPATPVHSATTAPTTTRTSTPSTTTAPSTTASSTTTTTRHTQPATATTHPTTTHPPTTTLPLTTAVPPVTTAATTVPTLSLPTTTAP
jgi:eukaryotic-like serine/threonine-protein kinase